MTNWRSGRERTQITIQTETITYCQRRISTSWIDNWKHQAKELESAKQRLEEAKQILQRETELHVNMLKYRRSLASQQPEMLVFQSERQHTTGTNPLFPHLNRDKPVQRGDRKQIRADANPQRLLETSLLTLFAFHYTDSHCIPISLIDVTATANEIIKRHGIHLSRHECRLPTEKQFVFMLDDAQYKYGDQAFWTSLVEDAESWIPSNMRFIISATESLEAADTPAAIEQLQSITTRDTFVVWEYEADQLLELANGPPAHLGFPLAKHVIKRECHGQIDALRVVIDCITAQFEITMPSERDVLPYCLTDRVMN